MGFKAFIRKLFPIRRRPAYECTGYYAACPKHITEEVIYRYSHIYFDYIPEACSKCSYEQRLSYLLSERSKGWKARKEEKRRRRAAAKMLNDALKEIYDHKGSGNPFINEE